MWHLERSILAQLLAKRHIFPEPEDDFRRLPYKSMWEQINASPTLAPSTCGEPDFTLADPLIMALGVMFNAIDRLLVGAILEPIKKSFSLLTRRWVCLRDFGLRSFMQPVPFR